MNTSYSTSAIILAAGKGTRMRSDLPKVMHKVANRPMLGHVIDAAKQAGCEPLLTVVAPGMRDVESYATRRHKHMRIAAQGKQLGTAHAVLAAQEQLADVKGHLLVLYGDTPLITPDTLKTMMKLFDTHTDTGVVVLGMRPHDPAEYGRLVTQDDGTLERIVEFKDANDSEKAIGLCNSGVIAIRGNHAWEMLRQIDNKNAKEEYYLTDVVAIANGRGLTCRVVECDETEVLGVNSRQQLADAEAALQQRLRKRALDKGVTLVAPETVYLSADTQMGRDVVIHPHVCIGPEVTIGDHVEVKAFTHIEGTVIGDEVMLGPYARIRPGSNIGTRSKIGNFVEIKKAEISQEAKISHLSYIGDAYVGEGANIGAGTITCNYDGFNKHHTEIGRYSFIGSNTALVAPVVVGAGAMIGAGSVVTEDVASDALALTRSPQTSKQSWAKVFRERHEQEADE